MSKIIIGKSGARNVAIDLDVLLRTRGLIQANSGGGKSWLVRRMIEQLFGKIQIIIIDPEGEFATLREKFDFVLVGEGGETTADLRSAGMVAEKLMELRASAICDLFETFRKTPQSRHAWTRAFCNALLDAPKKFWHPMILFIDEFQKFVPEKGTGESEASEAVIGIGTAGRKRGICLIGATQRLGKVRKDVTAELLNRFVGPTFEDVDVKRAADLLSVLKEDQKKFFAEMRMLEPGNFYCFGRAVSKVRVLCKIGPVETTHPEMGSAEHAAEPPPPTAAIAKLLPKLADLPRAAEEKARTIEEFKKQIRELKGQLRAQPRAEKPAEVKIADPRAVERAVRPVRALLEEAVRVIVKINAIGFEGIPLKPEEIQEALKKTAESIGKLAESKISARAAEFDRLKKEAHGVLEKLRKSIEKEDVNVDVTVKRNEPVTVAATPRRPMDTTVADGELSRSRRAILRAIAEFEAIGRKSIAKSWIAARTGASYTSSTFGNNLGFLRSMGYITYPGPDLAALTHMGRDAAGEIEAPQTSEELLASCLALLSESQRKILRALYEKHPSAVDKTELAELIGASAASSTYGNNLGALRSAGMIEYPASGQAKCADWLFID